MIPNIYSQSGFNFIEVDNEKYLRISSKNISDAMSYAKNNGIRFIEINYTQGYSLRNIDFVKDYDFIEGLSIVTDIEGINIEAVHTLSHLRLLNLNREPKQVLNLADFPKLEILKLEWNKNVRELSNCGSLKELRLSKYKRENLEELKELTALEALTIVQSKLTSLRGIEKLIKLNSLNLFYLPKLSSIEGIENLKELKELNIQNCPSIYSIEPISELKQLVKFELNNCKEIETIKPAKDLNNLEKFWIIKTEIRDGDLTPCFGKKDAFCTPKKYYSHTSEEIDKVNRTIR